MRSRVPYPGILLASKWTRKEAVWENVEAGAGPSVTLRLLGSEERPRSCGRQAPGRPGSVWRRLGLYGAKKERGERERDREARKMLKMALGSGGREGGKETVAAMTAARDARGQP